MNTASNRPPRRLPGPWSGLLPLLLPLLLTGGCDDGPAPDVPCEAAEACPIDQICSAGLCAAFDPADRDGDGVPDAIEALAGTDPAVVDTDGDGPDDGEELGWQPGTRLYDGPDTDDDGRIDALESDVDDRDGDGLTDQRDPCDDDPDCPVVRPLPCAADEGQPCAVGAGICAELGVTVCAPDGLTVTCMGEPGMPLTELCSGQDEDCDGAADEDYPDLGQACTAGVGGCAVEGVIACADDGTAACDAAPGAPREERCNGIDDDCDGMTDEDYPDLGFVCDAGLGACSARGVFECSPSGRAVVCGADTAEPEEERCNAVDDDCDGRIDETFGNVGQRCEVGVGACQGLGAFRCTADGLAAVCDATEGIPSPERCNTIDDDCDGIVDEGFDRIGEACVGGVGGCARPGRLICDPAIEGYACDAAPGAPEAEQCNERDDDCDGMTDEDFDLGEACAAGVGACRADGVTVCDPFNREVTCSARVGLPIDELCNGADDDCDGATDEAFPTLGDGCSAGIGACAVDGALVCTLNQRAVRCSAEEAAAGQERCNDLDDDCDGMIDEGFAVGEPCEAGLGLCARPGVAVCGDNGLLDCGAVPGDPAPETCDGRDEDCDGQTDEAFVADGLGAACSVGIGACRGDGQGVCTADGAGVVCDAEAGPPAGEESCNGIDDDCDGIPDEGFADLGRPCTAGLGLCAADGRQICAADGQGVACDASPGAPAAELCNRDDDDCDGATDEAFPTLGDACEVGIGACRDTGTVVCTLAADGTRCTARAGNPRVERCDEIDNDCDGMTDEDFGPGCARLAIEVSAGGYHTCARRPDDGILCFGSVDPPPAGAFASLAAGGDWHCALDAAGEPRCWGDGPAALFEPPPGPFEALALGTTHGCALDAVGAVRCWGIDSAGETTPPPGVRFVALDAGPALTCGVDTDAGLRCWGANDNGRGTPPPGRYRAVTLGSEHGCALDEDSAITCWGAAGLGRLDAPAVAVMAIDAGDFHTCALDAEGLPHCWGAGAAGEEPAFPRFGQSAPPDGMAFVELSAGGLHTCGRDAADVLWCWGAGSPDFAPDGFFHVGQATVP